MRTAAAIPDRIGAGASFHGGGLATDDDGSPHLLVPDMRASFLFAIAENDDERDPDAKVKLREAFDAASLNAEIEVYAGTLHGWCPPDSAVYDEEQAERAWGAVAGSVRDPRWPRGRAPTCAGLPARMENVSPSTSHLQARRTAEQWGWFRATSPSAPGERGAQIKLFLVR